MTTEELVWKCYKPRALNTHKGDYGRVLIVGGSVGMTGAVMMCAVAALRGGAGLVTVALPKSLNNSFEAAVLEAMSLPLPETEKMSISLDAVDIVLERANVVDVLAIGPGISRVPETQEFVRRLVRSSNRTIVLDADGIMAFAGKMDELKERSCELVLTPHPGEMAALTGKTVTEVQQDRIGISQAVAEELNAVVVLKGAHTVIASPDGNVYINLTGNPGMASGGTGDVLTGLIASLIAQGNKPFEAASCGVFLHGLAGDMASWDKGEASLIAGDLIEYLPKAITQPDMWMPICLRPLSARVWFVSRGRRNE
ncbi:MAG: NAD(P)H-hydrate dehydratase [Armatimonadetes bacterium]|nr:NAD(P)H-hydrate dehydratase [Armatimonadota bacterium]